MLRTAMARHAIALILISLAASAEEKPAPILDSATVNELKAFSISFPALMKDAHGDEQLTRAIPAIKDLSAKISDDHLSAVEQFALTKDGKTVRWVLARLLVERDKFDFVAHVLVADLAENKDERSYRMWKWWEYNFGERKDFMELSRKIGIALIEQFENGNADYKLVVAELFGKGEAEAKLTTNQFKTAIDFDKKTAK